MKLKKLWDLKKFSAMFGIFSLCGLFGISIFASRQKDVEAAKAESAMLLLQKDFDNVIQFSEEYQNVTYNCELEFVGYYQYYRFYDGVQTSYSVTISFTNIQYRDLTTSFIRDFERTDNSSGSVLITKTTDRYLYLRYDLGLELNSIVNTTRPPQPDETPEYWSSRFSFTLKYGSDTDISFNDVLGIPYFIGESRFYNRVYDEMLFEDDLTMQIGEYEQGYNDGYSVGETYGEQVGYTNGYGDGVEAGKQEQLTSDQELFDDYYAQGYSAGYAEADTQDDTVATIFGGILQVGMLPVSFFLSIFNFEILGINVGAFVSALLTLAITIIVVRLVIGNKGGGD